MLLQDQRRRCKHFLSKVKHDITTSLVYLLHAAGVWFASLGGGGVGRGMREEELGFWWREGRRLPTCQEGHELCLVPNSHADPQREHDAAHQGKVENRT